MTRPTTKAGLVEAANDEFAALDRLVDGMSEQERHATFAFEDRDRNVRDVLVHLTAWHGLLNDRIRSNSAGVARPFLPEPYTWGSYGGMNVEIWRDHQAISLAQAREGVVQSHAEVMQGIDGFDDRELFERGHFAWTGSTTLGAYCISATSSHYAWAAKKLRRHRRTYVS